MEIKSIKEYANEMTREEFDQFTEQNELCPSHFGLSDTFTDEYCNSDNCKECYNQSLNGIEFKSLVPALPEETLLALKQLEQLEISAKAIKDQQDKLKANLLDAMETHGVKKWDNDIMTISYVAPTTKTTVDSAKLKKELPDVFKKYSKTSNVKSSVRIKLK